jgi:phosphatidylserine/phosphatidylglycerophosphate/cardiolipin synthase-like enzyme
MSARSWARASAEGLTFRAYRGDGCALLAFDLEASLAPNLAGFAVQYTPPAGEPQWILNRLSFTRAITSDTTPSQRRWTPTNVAPLQKFQWAHFPPDVVQGSYRYRTTAMLFVDEDGSELAEGPSAELDLPLVETEQERFELGLTRGYISSQAYADRFGNAAIRPKPATLDYDTAPFEEQYAWLGSHARQLILAFLAECVADPSVTVDAFAYDLDEPTVVRELEKLGSRLRIYLDDSASHVEAGALEVDAKARLIASAGAANVRVGHFSRYAHDKVLIQKRAGQPTKVLTGSANFSVRGLYVQANSVLLLDEPGVADLYARVFEQTWDDAAGFAASDLAGRWFAVRRAGLPRMSASFAPHKAAEVSLDRVADAIAAADSSVLFAVMELGGTGRVLDELRNLASKGNVFSYGMTQRADGSLSVVPPARQRGLLVPFAYLSAKVPQPFRAEWSGGQGQVIHHKFVVVDFNDSAPVVFTGSSNLAAGGETSNGDNLLAIYDRAVATAYAVEAIRLVDHYYFRALQRKATSSEPLRLRTRSERWWQTAYADGSIKQTSRALFAR